MRPSARPPERRKARFCALILTGANMRPYNAFTMCVNILGMRIAMGIEYEGTAYNGFQEQLGGNTIAGCLNAAISQVANEPIECVCAGRTDTGVHARGQVIHFDTQAIRSEHAWLMGVNRYLPPDIAVSWVKQVSDTFHARFSAKARRYHYQIINTRARPGLNARFHTWHCMPLDAQRMHEGAQYLLGNHDFSSFRGRDCQAKSPLKTVEYCNIQREGDIITLDIKGNAFLYHMVRNIVGTLTLVGEGKQPVDWIVSVMESRNRINAGPTAPPNGLTLLSIDYPEQYNLQL